jgi:hypothetical protein
MPVQKATGKDLKTISVFIAPNGKKYEGRASDYYEGRAKEITNNVGGTTSPDRLPGATQEIKTGQKE